MDEKLNQEIRDYIGAQKSDVFRDVAEHFYNLALEDVRKEVENHKNLLKCEGEYTNYAGRRLDEAKDVLTFVDNLQSKIMDRAEQNLASGTYDTKIGTTPFVNFIDVVRVQFAANAKVIEKKRKAILDWDKFQKVAYIFYSFGKKDLALTWEDVKLLDELMDKVLKEYTDTPPYEEFYTEVIRRFNEQRGK